MPFRSRLIDQGRILLVRGTGAADAGDWQRLIDSPALQIARFGVVLDLRRRRPLPTPDVALDIGRRLAKLAHAVPAIAMVANPGAQLGLTRMVDAMAEGAGVSTRSFTSLREACDWVRETL